MNDDLTADLRYRPRSPQRWAQLIERALAEDRYRARGIRPPLEREFGYMPIYERPELDDVNERHHADNVALAARYPRAASEWAKDDAAFQRFMQAAMTKPARAARNAQDKRTRGQGKDISGAPSGA